MKTIFTTIGIAFVLGLVIFAGSQLVPSLHIYGSTSATNIINTTSKGFVASTSTVNTTSTQLFSNVDNNISYLINNTTSTLTCSLDGRSVTAASSSLVSGRGLIVGPTTGTVIPAEVAFGQCVPGTPNCYPTTGSVNCLANVAASVDKLIQ